MGQNVNFYLRKPNASGKSLLYLQFKYRSQRLIFTFNQTIDPDNWNKKKQRIKISSTTTTDGLHLINDLLDNLEKICLHTYNKEIGNGIPTTSKLRSALNDFLDHNTNEEEKESKIPTIFNLIDRFISGEITKNGVEKRYSTLQGYKTSKNSLIAFQKEAKYPVNFESINLDFFHRYVNFLKKKGLAHNSIAKRIRTLKTFLNEGFHLGYHSKVDFKRYSVAEKEVDSVYLNEAEIIQIYNYDFSNSKRLEQVRDLFVFGCFVGLRYSDYSTIKPENIINIEGEIYLRVKTKKTENVVVIPCHPIVLEIFRKYEKNTNSLPPSISSVKFNLYLKEACKIAGLTQTGCLISNPDVPKWQAISSHTARRSFCTNLYLADFQILDIMKVSGHKTLASFLRYVKMSNVDTAVRLSKHIKKSWNPDALIKAKTNVHLKAV